MKIDGDSAKGVVSFTVNGMEMKQTIDFVKAGGGWKLAPLPQP